MGVNRQKNHLVVYLEDSPYREIMNGIKTTLNINEQFIDVKNPCGGWGKVFAELDDNAKLINNNIYMYVLLLIDYDNQYQSRYGQFNRKLDEQFSNIKNRIFILGIDDKESEDLKKSLGHQNYEQIGKELTENCPNETASSIWTNKHLSCNAPEIARLRVSGVFDWLFKSS